MTSKSHFAVSLVLAFTLSSLTPGQTQTEPAKPTEPGIKFSGNASFQPKMTEGNLEATAMVAGFFLNMKRAKTYQGRMVMTKTITQPGQTTQRKIAEWKSVWRGDGSGIVKNLLASGTFTTINGVGADEKKVVDRTVQVEDGITRRCYAPDKNTYTDEPWKDDDPDMAVTLGHMMWPMMLMAFSTGDEFAVNAEETAKTPGQIVVHSTNHRTQFGIDAATGNMRFWYMDSGSGEVTEIRWLDLKLNAMVTDKDLAWTPPAGAKKVPLDGNKREFVF